MSPLSEDGRQPASTEVSGEGYLLEEMMQLRGPRMAGWAHWQEEKRVRYEQCIWCRVCSVDEVGALEIFKMGKRNDGELKKDLWKGTGEWSVGGEEGMKWVAGTITRFIWIGCSKLFFLMYWLCHIIWNNRGKAGLKQTNPWTGGKGAAILLLLLATTRTITLREAVFIHQTDYSMNQTFTQTSIIMDSSRSCRK